MPSSSTETAVYAGVNGFLGTRGSFMLDVVFLAMFLVVPALGVSIWLAKSGKLHLHKRLQLALGAVLLLAVVAFELDMRINGWEARAVPSPYFDANAKWQCPVGISLMVHLCFAIPTAILWVYTIAMAMRKFDHDLTPNAYNAQHRKLGWIAAIEMVGTAVTGWIFYYLAFIAK